MTKVCAILVVALFLITSISSGFAAGQTGTMTVSDNTVGEQYIVLNLYTKDNSDEFKTASADELFSKNINYTSTYWYTTYYSANGSYQLSSDDLYIMTSAIGMGSISTYTFSASATVKGISSDKCSVWFEVYSKDTDGEYSQKVTASSGGTYVLDLNEYYRIVSGVNMSYSGNSKPDLTLDVTLESVCTDKVTGAYLAKDLKHTYTHLSSNEDVAEMLKEANPNLSGYTISSDPAGTHDGYPAANISNNNSRSGGIAFQRQIDLTLTIPQGYGFVIYLQISNTSYWDYSSTFNITISQGNEVLVTGVATLRGGSISAYLSSVNKDGTSSGYFYDDLSSVSQNNAWMTGKTSDITVKITSNYQSGTSTSANLKMDFVFQPQ